MKREFLMLAQTFDPKRDHVGGWYASEKLDGMRAYWDGGITCGIPCSEIPWANTAKHARFKEQPIATGLWTRYGQPINAPEDWIKELPLQPLDGELTLGRGTFQKLVSITKTTTYHKEEWEDVKYAVFDSPSPRSVFADGSINNTNFKKRFDGCALWAMGKLNGFDDFHEKPFYAVLAYLRKRLVGNPIAYCHEQVQLPSSSASAQEVLDRELHRVEDLGGEGLMLRSPISFWKPERHYGLLKLKSLRDAEGIVIGYKWAKPTDLERSVSGQKTDKLLGLMGSLRLRLDSGVEFDLSGFSDDERRIVSLGGLEPEEVTRYGREHPGEAIPANMYNPTFPRGTRVTFRYRELTVDGAPKEARYHRVRTDHP